MKKCEGTGLIEKSEAFYAELSERAAANFLQYIYSVLVVKNHHKIRSRCLVH